MQHCRSAVPFVLLGLATTSCGGGSPTTPAPPPRFSVNITAPQTAASVRTGDGWDCRFRATARSSGGTTSQFATFTGVHLYAQYPDGEQWSDGWILPVDYWGSNRINHASIVQSGNYGLKALPQRNMRFRGDYYLELPSGEERSFNVWVRCQ